MAEVRRVSSGELTSRELASLRALFVAAWSDPEDRFSEDDFEHALGGVHFIVDIDGTIVSHASVVPRTLDTGDLEVSTGYVEAVATLPEHERRGYGSAVMTAAGEHIEEIYQLGALGTGLLEFYGRLGWTPWRGPTSVLFEGRRVPTPEDDGYVLVRMTPSSPALDLDAPISCEWRQGDAW